MNILWHVQKLVHIYKLTRFFVAKLIVKIIITQISFIQLLQNYGVQILKPI